MKTPQHSAVQQIARIKPGGLVTLPPRLIKRTGWKVGDTLHLSVEGGRILVERIPEEREWRITRLRLRAGAAVQRNSSPMQIRGLGDLLALRRGRQKPGKSNHDQGTPRRTKTVAPPPDRPHPTRKDIQARWRALEEETDRLFDELATYLECEHPDLVREITETLGDDVTALHIARSIRGELFMASGDTWRKDVRQRIMWAAFGICA